MSLYPEHGRDYEALRRNADTAMYRAKDGVKGGASFFAAFDSAAHRALAHVHCHVVNRGVHRQWKSVNGFDLFSENVFELLSDDDSGNESADLGFDVRVFERTLGDDALFRLDDLESALRGAAGSGGHGASGSGLRRLREHNVAGNTEQ